MSDIGKHVPGTDPPQPPETREYNLNHLMLRIRNPEKSLKFYREVIGLRTLFTFNAGPMTIYYVGHIKDDQTGAQAFAEMASRRGLVELVHIHGEENSVISNGNEGPNWGFGHIGITVPNAHTAMERFRSMGVPIFKELGTCSNDLIPLPPGKSELVPDYHSVYKQIGMIKDPDG